MVWPPRRAWRTTAVQLVAALLCVSHTSGTPAQVRPQPRGNQGSPYEHYGRPVEAAVAAVHEGRVATAVLLGAIRTRGRFNSSEQNSAAQARSRGHGQVRLPFILMDLFVDVGIAIMPVPEIADPFIDEASTRGCRRLEVVGTFAPELGSGDPSVPSSAMRVWSYTVLGDCEPRAQAGSMLTLERLVEGIASFDRRDVRIRGIFVGRAPTRGGECPQAPAGAWAMEDGPFQVWVYGAQPRGPGWRLDSRGDALWWIAVKGRATATRDCILVKAREVMLLTSARAVPPRP